MPKAQKGSEFERTICKQLSRWWTQGTRDDIFWRSSQSGGRATQRSKKGLKTFGSYGDIAAVDPIGQPLIDTFTIELKRGSSYSTPGDLLDFKGDNTAHAWVKCLLQAHRCAQESGSKTWLMICKRDRRTAVVYLPTESLSLIGPKALLRPPCCRYRITIKNSHRSYGRFDFVGMSLENFLLHADPQKITTLKTWKKKHSKP